MPNSKKSRKWLADRKREYHELTDPKEEVAPKSKRNWKLHKGKKYIRVDISKFDDNP